MLPLPGKFVKELIKVRAEAERGNLLLAEFRDIAKRFRIESDTYLFSSTDVPLSERTCLSEAMEAIASTTGDWEYLDYCSSKHDEKCASGVRLRFIGGINDTNRKLAECLAIFMR
jgi:hypothetical protein